MDPALIAGAVVLVLSSIGGTVVLIINAYSASADRREASRERQLQLTLAQAAAARGIESNAKADTIIASTTKIHELTNSTNSNLQKALELMTEKASGLEKVIAELREAKRDTAAVQTLANQRQRIAPVAAPVIAVPAIVPAVPLSPAIEEKLEAIETNTAATAEGVKNLKP